MQESKQQIAQFVKNTVTAIGLLFKSELYGQTKILMYSAIDTMGLLDAPAGQEKATGETFKAWVRKYILADTKLPFSDVDLWAARCAVLHTFTTASDLSNGGKAKEIIFFVGQADSPMMKAFHAATLDVGKDTHVPAVFSDFLDAFLEGIERFMGDLIANCEKDPAYSRRLGKVIQTHMV